MTHNIPQFYRRWIRCNLGVSESSDFVFHKGKNYAYLIMGGPGDAPGNLFIFVFRNADKDKEKETKYLKMHRIQATEVLVDHLENMLNTLEKAD
jgi:hypothetical protein